MIHLTFNQAQDKRKEDSLPETIKELQNINKICKKFKNKFTKTTTLYISKENLKLKEEEQIFSYISFKKY